MGRALKYDIPGPDWRVDFADACERGAAGLFTPELVPPERLVLEIGFGRGEFLLQLAERDPAAGFIGVEYSFKRVLKLARRLARSELRNVRLIEAAAQDLVDQVCAPGSISEAWINFPDPWPKKRHAGRRLIHPAFVHELALRLVPGACLHAATDDVPYAEQSHETLSKEPLLENAFAPSAWLPEVAGRMPTAYELEWRAEGRPLHFFCYRRIASPEES